MFNSIDNKIIERAYANPSYGQVFPIGSKGLINIPERLFICDSGLYFISVNFVLYIEEWLLL